VVLTNAVTYTGIWGWGAAESPKSKDGTLCCYATGPRANSWPRGPLNA